MNVISNAVTENKIVLSTYRGRMDGRSVGMRVCGYAENMYFPVAAGYVMYEIKQWNIAPASAVVTLFYT